MNVPQLDKSANQEHALIQIIWMTSGQGWSCVEQTRAPGWSSAVQKQGVREPLPSVHQLMRELVGPVRDVI